MSVAPVVVPCMIYRDTSEASYMSNGTGDGVPSSAEHLPVLGSSLGTRRLLVSYPARIGGQR